MRKLDEYHDAEEIADHTWRIDEHHMVNCYLLIGTEKALLIDTGCGAGFLPTCLRLITDLPITVAVTHRHPDHVGGAWEFGSYDAPAADIGMPYDLMCISAVSNRMIRAGGARAAYRKPDWHHGVPMPMKDGQVYELGGRTIRTMSVPGHTRGSVVFIEDSARRMFTGDDINPCLWMHLPGCTSLEKWREGARKIMALADQGYESWYGHGDGRQTAAQMHAMYDLVEKAIAARRAGTLPKGKHPYPSASSMPYVYCNYANVLEKK